MIKMQKNNNKISSDEKNRAENITEMGKFIFALFVTMIVLIVQLVKTPTTLSKVNFVEGRYLKMNSYYKTITLEIKKNNDKFTKETFDFCGDEFKKMSPFLGVDSTDHFVQLWYVVDGKSLYFYQIIVDDIIIAPFDKWVHLRPLVEVIAFIAVLLIILLIFYFKNKRKRVTFSEHNLPIDG